MNNDIFYGKNEIESKRKERQKSETDCDFETMGGANVQQKTVIGPHTLPSQFELSN